MMRCKTARPKAKTPPTTVRSKAIARVFAFLLGLDEESISMNDSFLIIGGNSLLAMKAAAAIWTELGLTIPMPPAVVIQYPTIIALEMFIDRAAGQETTKEHILNTISSLETRVSSLMVASHCPLGESGAIFLTGATGFLGRFLLGSLLGQSSATVYCLVRGAFDSQTFAMKGQELLSQLPDNVHKRVRVVQGDITQRNLGMSQANYEKLLQIRFSHVVHSAAKVHWLAPFDALFQPNVEATASLLQFSAQVH